MTSTAVHAVGLSKTYQIPGVQVDRYHTLRSDLASAVDRIRGHRSSGEPQAVAALRDVSFDVEAGEAVGVIGRNGAGKSTLLKILSRVSRPSSGYVDVYGTVGALLEVGTGFHPELSGRENTFLSGAILGMSKREIADRFDEIVAFAEVESFIDTPVKRYSSGMYARLAFAVAAHLRPSILIVDEVLSVGDLAFQAKCLAHMKRLTIEGTAVLFVSHNLLAVSDFCPRALLLIDGELSANGPTTAVVTQYRRHIAETPFRATTTSSPIRPVSLQINGRDVGGSVELKANDPLRVTLEVQSTVDVAEAILNVVVETADGRLAMHLRSDIANAQLSLRGGLNTLAVDVADVGLAPGDYWLWLRLVGRDTNTSSICDTERIFLEVLGNTTLASVAWPKHSFHQEPVGLKASDDA